MGTPKELKPVLAFIEHIDELGTSRGYEVVYFDKQWKYYSGSTIFRDGEKVLKWRYCEQCFTNNIGNE
jgi:hypothetical protein